MRWVVWDDELLIYHEPTGDLHVLNEVAAGAFYQLKAGTPPTASVLAERVAAALGYASDSTFERHIERLLMDFQEAGLTIGE